MTRWARQGRRGPGQRGLLSPDCSCLERIGKDPNCKVHPRRAVVKHAGERLFKLRVWCSFCGLELFALCRPLGTGIVGGRLRGALTNHERACEKNPENRPATKRARRRIADGEQTIESFGGRA